MATKKFVYLTYLDAVEKHFELMDFFDEEQKGIFSKSLIKSALTRPKQAAIYEDADIIRQAATLCFGLIKNHPWLADNKRTATFLTEIFHELNGYRLKFELVEIIELSLNIESDEWKVDEIEIWLRERAYKI